MKKNINYLNYSIINIIILFLILLFIFFKAPNPPSFQKQLKINENITEFKDFFVNKDREKVFKIINKDLDYDEKEENIVITFYSPEPFINFSFLYIFLKQTKNEIELIDYIKISGILENITIDDINDDNFIEILIFYTSGKLLGTEIYQYKEKKINSISFYSGGKKIKIWSQKRPEFIDLDGDNIKEIIVTHFLRGEVLDEVEILKEFFKWNGYYYEKYDEKREKEKIKI